MNPGSSVFPARSTTRGFAPACFVASVAAPANTIFPSRTTSCSTYSGVSPRIVRMSPPRYTVVADWAHAGPATASPPTIATSDSRDRTDSRVTRDDWP